MRLISGFLLLPLLRHVRALAAHDYYVTSLPGQPADSKVTMHAGNILVDEPNNGALFFWHIQNKHIADKSRTIIWFNGGPGCSSEDGAMMEIGPFKMKSENELVENEGSWHEFANLLFIDQPVGTGFSYVNTDSYIHELPEMANHLMIFLQKYFEIFPENRENEVSPQPTHQMISKLIQLYLAGESYAGQYIPYLADAILRAKENSTVDYNFRGMLIGNGWIDPKSQYPAYLPFAYQNGILEEGSADAEAVEAAQGACKTQLAQGENHVDEGLCENVLSEILRVSRKKHGGKCVNQYDVRLTDDYPSCGMNWPEELSLVKPYLRRQEVADALNVNHDKRTGWVECVGSVSSSFRARNSRPSVELLPYILERVPVLLFCGESDLICNCLGLEDMMHSLHWNNATGFEESPGTWAPRQTWTFGGQTAGYYQHSRNLTYVLYHNASHMVPVDLPLQSRDMVNRFMNVSVSSIGGASHESLIAGSKAGPSTSVSDDQIKQDEADEAARISQATRRAYYKAGGVALLFVIIASLVLAWWVYRQRKLRGLVGFGLRDFLLGNWAKRNRTNSLSTAKHGRYRHPRAAGDNEDEEMAGEENELDELVVESPMFDSHREEQQARAKRKDHMNGTPIEPFAITEEDES